MKGESFRRGVVDDDPCLHQYTIALNKEVKKNVLGKKKHRKESTSLPTQSPPEQEALADDERISRRRRPRRRGRRELDARPHLGRPRSRRRQRRRR